MQFDLEQHQFVSLVYICLKLSLFAGVSPHGWVLFCHQPWEVEEDAQSHCAVERSSVWLVWWSDLGLGEMAGLLDGKAEDYFALQTFSQLVQALVSTWAVQLMWKRMAGHCLW